MAEIITVAEIKAIQPTSLPDSVIQAMIATIDQADTCLDQNNVPADVQKLLKLYGTAHMVYGTTKGNVKSERSPTGGSRTYRDTKQNDPLNGSTWGTQLLGLDQYGCVTRLLQRNRTMAMISVGPRGCP